MSADDMPDAKVTIRVTDFDELPGIASSRPLTLIAGKAKDCNLVIPRRIDAGISRHHCMFDINPPYVSVKDLGSRNGTYVNGENIRDHEEPVPLDDGAKVQVCNTMLTIEVKRAKTSKQKTTYCIRCGCSMEVSRQQWDSTGDYLCDKCRCDSTAFDATECTSLDGVSKKQLLFGYRVIRKLGKGALGAVYLAQPRGSIKQYALKLMLPEMAVHEDNRTRFLREVEALRSLDHGQIVQAYKNGYDDGIFYIVLEYCNAGTVGDRVRKNGPLKIEEALTYQYQLLDALDYAHNARLGELEGFVHRDIKPGNVLLHETGGRTILKLADFGLCKAFNGSGLCSFTQTGTVAGTFSFMCKQQLLNYKHADAGVDVWSAAAILYFMLTGHAPRKCSTFTAILDSKPMPVRERNPDVPEQLAALLDDALDDQGDDLLFDSAEDFKHALQALAL